MTGAGVTRRLLLVLGGVLCLSVVFALFTEFGGVAGALLAGIAALFWLVDFLLTPGKKSFHIQRTLPRQFEQSVESEVVLTLSCDAGFAVDVRISDTAPETFRVRKGVFSFTLDGGIPAGCMYPVVPLHRGAFSFGKCYVEVRGRWGLCTKRFAVDCPDEVRVYPNLTPMRHYRLLAARNQLAREDTALHKIRGAGSDFAGLREYVTGDDWRKINWKASARANKLITNIYDVEKNRDVILAVDTGRWMQAGMGDVTRLDRALELTAAIMQVAVSSGDRVGLILFDLETSYYLPPGKGAAQIRTFLQALYGAKATESQPDYAALSATLRHKLTKRAFICVLTYLDSTAEASVAASELFPLSRRHSLYIASLTDTGLEQLIQTEAAVPEAVYLKSSAAYRKIAGLSAVEVLRRHGIQSYAAEPSELLMRSVRQYLSIKRIHQ